MKSMTLDGFAAFLLRLPEAVRQAEHRGLEHGALLIEAEAKAIIGQELQQWPALADSTVAQKAARGQTGRVSSTDPLFATGELRATISHQIEGNVAVIGTPDEVGVYQEVGTDRIPPRPFLSTAAFRKGEAAANAIGAAVGHAIAGREWLP